MSDKTRIIELQRCLKIAREALLKIKHGHCGGRSPESTADDAISDMLPFERKTPLQGLVGHEGRRP